MKRIRVSGKIAMVWIAFLQGILFSCARAEEEIPEIIPPNILFAIADDASWEHFGAYGCDWVKTPALDKIAREGILFSRAYTPNAKCAPSRSCILTGLNSWQLRAAANHVPYFPPTFSSYVEVLEKHGYQVGYTGKGWAPGVAIDQEGKFRELTGPLYSEHTLIPPTPFMAASDYAVNFSKFLEEKTEGEPFCFWYGGFEPHRFYEFASGMEKGGKSTEEIDRVPDFWPDVDTVRQDLLDYAFEIEHFDSHLMQMLQLLEEKGELENTLVVVTADNGMPFPRVKGQVYEYSNHLPLAIMWPGGIENPGRVVDDFVSFIDFAPTFLEVAGVDLKQSGMQEMEGRSLTEIFYSKKSGQVVKERDFVLVGKERHDLGRPFDLGYPVRGIVKGEWLYLHNYHPDRWPAGNPETGYLNCDGGATKSYILNQRRVYGNLEYWEHNFGLRVPEELYHIKSDPCCLNNLVNDPAYASKREELSTDMTAKLTAQGDPRILGNGEVFMSYPYAQADRGLYEKIMAGEQVNTGWVYDTDFEPEWLQRARED
ncbi:MAG: sulfatase [Bacteroidales bacterium]|nr:sulfatase [Bacteroidales bacterium]